jgi:hypothetical protein
MDDFIGKTTTPLIQSSKYQLSKSLTSHRLNELYSISGAFSNAFLSTSDEFWRLSEIWDILNSETGKKSIKKNYVILVLKD